MCAADLLPDISLTDMITDMTEVLQKRATREGDDGKAERFMAVIIVFTHTIEKK